MIERINVLWAIPLLLPFVFVVMIRLLWGTLGLSWEPSFAMACFVVAWAAILGVMSAVIVFIMQADGEAIWWTFKKEKSDGRMGL